MLGAFASNLECIGNIKLNQPLFGNQFPTSHADAFKVSFEHILLGMEPEELFGPNESTKTKMKLLIEQLYDLGKEL